MERVERESLVLRRTYSQSAASSPRPSAPVPFEIDFSQQGESKCPSLKPRSSQVAFVRSRIRSLFAFVCGLVTLILIVNLMVGVEMSTYFMRSQTHLKNETNAIPVAPRNKVLPKGAPSKSRVKKPKRPDTSATKKGKRQNSTIKSDTSTSTQRDKPWFHDDSVESTGDESALAPLVANASAVFADRWCDLQNVDWIPSSTHVKWQRRAPNFLIPGAKYSGTLELAQELALHPSIVPGRTLESSFFFQHNFQRYI
jgi:hypothetical protein